MQLLLEVGRARIRADEDRLLLERDAGRGELARRGRRRLRRVARRAPARRHASHAASSPRRRAAARAGSRARAPAASTGSSARAARPGLREPLREREQPLRARAGEAVDRLVVVADRAQLVAPAEPEVEERLLQQVDVLVLVDRERAPALADECERRGVVLEQADRALEQVFEVEGAGLVLAALVLAEDAVREVGRDGRLVTLEPREVRLRRQAAVLRPLDLGGEVARRPELVGRRQPVADLAEQQRLRREDPAGIAREPAQQGERGRVKRRRTHALDAEGREPRPELAGRLVREGDGDDVRRGERAARDLPRDPPRDRRRLPRPRSREDADGAVRRLDGGALLVVQAREDRLGVQGRPPYPGDRPAS